MDLAVLDSIVQGQAERNVMGKTIVQYLGLVSTIARKLYENPELRYIALEHDDATNCVEMYTGLASRVYKLKMPMDYWICSYLEFMFSMLPS
jgi:hypothetical protein